MTVYQCNDCDLIMVERPTFHKGRCPRCGNKLYPNGYTEHNISATTIQSYYPAPSWEEDLKDT